MKKSTMILRMDDLGAASKRHEVYSKSRDIPLFREIGFFSNILLHSKRGRGIAKWNPLISWHCFAYWNAGKSA